MAAAIPVASFGRDPKVAEAVKEKLLPDYDVVHVSLDLAVAEAELPAVCGGALDGEAASALGSNAGRAAGERLVPKVVFFGGDISDADVAKVTGLVKERAPDVAFVKVGKMDVLKAGGLGPNPDVIAKVFRKKMAKE